MDAKHFAQIDRQKDTQTQQRSLLSQQHTEQGFTCLTQALEAATPGEKKTFLLQACDAFTEGIRYQRSNPEPYVGFAYVLMLIGNTDKALSYITEAQRLQPDHDDVALILAEIGELKSREASSKPTAASQPKFERPGSAKPNAGPDYDALYDQLELEIMAEVKSLMTAPLVKAKVSIDAQNIAAFEQQIQAIKQQLARFERQLKIVDEEIDIGELSIKLKPIEGMLRRFQQVKQVSLTLSALCKEIVAQHNLVGQILKETRLSTDPEDVQIVEENLEVFLDQADSFANRLDQIEAQGHDIEAGLQRYNPLLVVIEALQDALDDLKTQFGQRD